MGRVPGPPEDRNYVIQHLWEHQRTMVRLNVAGWKPKAIAEILGCTPQNVSDVICSPIAQKYSLALRTAADEVVATAQSVIADTGLRAAELTREVVENGTLRETPVPQRDQLLTIRDLLDRGPAPKVSAIRGAIAHFPVTEEMLNRVRDRVSSARQEALARGEIVEAEVLSEGVQNA